MSSPTPDERRAEQWRLGHLPVTIKKLEGGGTKLLIDGHELVHPIKQDSISVKPWHGRLNELTLTLVVGEVTMEIDANDRVPEIENGMIRSSNPDDASFFGGEAPPMPGRR